MSNYYLATSDYYKTRWTWRTPEQKAFYLKTYDNTVSAECTKDIYLESALSSEERVYEHQACTSNFRIGAQWYIDYDNAIDSRKN